MEEIYISGLELEFVISFTVQPRHWELEPALRPLKGKSSSIDSGWIYLRLHKNWCEFSYLSKAPAVLNGHSIFPAVRV